MQCVHAYNCYTFRDTPYSIYKIHNITSSPYLLLILAFYLCRLSSYMRSAPLVMPLHSLSRNQFKQIIHKLFTTLIRFIFVTKFCVRFLFVFLFWELFQADGKVSKKCVASLTCPWLDLTRCCCFQRLYNIRSNTKVCYLALPFWVSLKRFHSVSPRLCVCR